jgi:phospholipid/cholesterol/gamma-HCH transport system substrate-binding protein
MWRHPSLIIAAAALAAVTFFVTLAKPHEERLDLKCYFQNAQGLRPGARVRVAGVEVGSVTSVRVRPELRDHPAEVSMSLDTPYELKIPSGSVVALEAAGVFGEVFLQIDIQGAIGPPVQNGGILPSREMVSTTPEQWAEFLSNLVEHKSCDVGAKAAPAGLTTGPQHR